MTYEKTPQKCNVCGNKIVLTNSYVVFGKLSGNQLYFYCNYCKAWTVAKYNEKTERYEATGILATKKMRTLQKEILKQLEQEYTQNVPEKYQPYLKKKAYELIAGYLQIDIKDCYITTLNINQLYDVQSILEHSWDSFISEKRKVITAPQLIGRAKPKKKSSVEKRAFTFKPLTEEELLEVKEQADYILKGRQHLNWKNRGEV